MSATHRLRLTLKANALTSALGGVIAFVGATAVSKRLGIDHVPLTRAIGAALVLFALGGWWAATRSLPELLHKAALVSAADAAWVIGSVIVVATGALTTTGNLVVLIAALVVADFGATQLWLRATSRAATSTPQNVAA